MKVLIVRREPLNGEVVRHLSCGHRQNQTHGSYAPTAIEAFCRKCKAESERTPHVDTRSELTRVADELEAVYVFPAGRAWSRADVLVRKLLNAVRERERRAVEVDGGGR